MGLDDLIPEDVDESTSGVPQKQTKTEENDEIVESFGKPPYRKEFKKEQWEKVKRVIRTEFGMKVGEVISSPNEERYELLHEAIMFVESDKESGESENSSTTRCAYCGGACDDIKVVLEGESFCLHHTAAQVHNELHNE